jgi:hypothetical protein
MSDSTASDDSILDGLDVVVEDGRTYTSDEVRALLEKVTTEVYRQIEIGG